MGIFKHIPGVLDFTNLIFWLALVSVVCPTMTLYPFWKHLVYAAEAKGFSFSDHKCLQACDKKTFWIAQHQSYTQFCAITDEEMKAIDSDRNSSFLAPPLPPAMRGRPKINKRKKSWSEKTSSAKKK